jgi:outer membrane receptor protein involved in Fe transport
VLIACVALGPAVAAGVVPDPADADEIVVTGVRPTALADTTKSATVITAADIAYSPATGLAELLAAQANVNLRAVTGNDKFAGVDIRGSGDTFTSNVLVLVDGVRLNPPDLAGPDLSSIALDNVERIEVVRGANGVRYGSGAVAGVVNILTRGWDGQPRASAGVTVGSFETLDVFAALSGGTGAFAGSARLAWQDSAGYRENGALDRLDAQLRGQARLGAAATLNAAVDLHADEYGLPGPVSAEAFAGSEAQRRASATPDDGGETRDNHYRAGLSLALPAGQAVRVAGHFRDRRNDYVLGYTPLLTLAQQADRINEHTGGLDLEYSVPWHTANLTGDLVAGVNLFATRYDRQEDGTDLVGRSTTLASDLDGAAGFLTATARLGERWQASAGYRADATALDAEDRALVEVCDYTSVPGIPIPVPVDCRPEQVVQGRREERWRNSAVDAGVLFVPRADLRFFLNASRSFRVPNADELAIAADDLRPQHAWHADAGLRAGPAADLSLALTAFYVATEAEILYGLDPASGEGVNRNAAERTERLGGELELGWQALPTLYVTGNAGYTRARFASGAQIPLVPEWTVAGALRWRARPRLSASVAVRYVGARSDGNDYNGGTYPELDAYAVADARLTWQGRLLRWTAGVANALDEVAAASAYSSAIYPLAGRSVYAGVSAAF